MNKVQYDHILIRFGELYTKGKNRKLFVNKLYGNIKKALLGLENLKLVKTHDRLYIHLCGQEHTIVVEKLKNVFGISSFSLAIKCNTNLGEISAVVLNVAQESEAETFKIITKRKDKQFEMNSDAINRHLATIILKNTEKKVDVKNPELKIHVELQTEFTYITTTVIKGLSGYPVGSNGKSLLMLSGGIDSPVAAYLMMKRGMSLRFVHFASQPYTSEQAKQKVLDLAKILTKYQSNITVDIVNFTKLQLAIYEHTPEPYTITVMRRMMYRIMDKLCEKNHLISFVNGENLGQVASQTIESMQVIGEVTNKVILKPLLTYDKLEIIDLANQIGTYETSIIPFEDCCTIFKPKQPTTKPKSHLCEMYEAKFDYESYIVEALQNVETYHYNVHEKELEELF